MSINALRSLPKMERHWITIKKYLKIIQLIQKYSPQIELEDSKFKITKSKIYKRFNIKEQLILFLFNNHALNKEHSIDIPSKYKNREIRESIGYLFNKNENDTYYLSNSGIDVFKSISSDLTDLIYNNKEIGNIFPEEEIELITPKDSADFADESYWERGFSEIPDTRTEYPNEVYG